MFLALGGRGGVVGWGWLLSVVVGTIINLSFLEAHLRIIVSLTDHDKITGFVNIEWRQDEKSKMTQKFNPLKARVCHVLYRHQFHSKKYVRSIWTTFAVEGLVKNHCET